MTLAFIQDAHTEDRMIGLEVFEARKEGVERETKGQNDADKTTRRKEKCFWRHNCHGNLSCIAEDSGRITDCSATEIVRSNPYR